MTRVVAQTITNTEVVYECPHCWTSRNGSQHSTNKFKNGNTAKDRKPTLHQHRTDGESADSFDNGKTFSRISHCRYNTDEVRVRITKDTKRINK